jgi:electron transport complex protein RnfB
VYTGPTRHTTEQALIDVLDEALPQLQCRRCGYPACRPYARALVTAAEEITLCAPGGEGTRRRLSALLGRDSAQGELADETPRVARVVERDCIGCARCLAACPVDAIVGAQGFLHTIVADWCTGCDLCPAVCPTDCIVLEASAIVPDPAQARARYAERVTRLATVTPSQQLVDLPRAAHEAQAEVAAVLARRGAGGVTDGENAGR